MISAVLVAIALHVPSVTIIVSSDQWHSEVALPVENGVWEEWGFASRIWYFERRSGPVALAQTLLWPNGPGVIERVEGRTLLYERSTQQPAYAWEFDLTDEQLALLRAFIRASFLDEKLPNPEGREFHPAIPAYNLFHTCHHWLAHALQAAGIPVRSVMAALPELFWKELDRVSPRGRSRLAG